MIECLSIEHNFHKTPNVYPNISNDQQFRLKIINEIKDGFIFSSRDQIKRTNERKS